jgi:hypothetical protein
MAGLVSDDRTMFYDAFPREPSLDALVLAFKRGNFARVRRDAPRVIKGAAADDVKAAAADLLARTKPDPLSYVFFALTALLLVVLSGYWWSKAGP